MGSSLGRGAGESDGAAVREDPSVAHSSRVRLGRTSRLLLASILLAHGLLGIGYLVSIPPWEAPDEPAHFRRVRNLAERVLPSSHDPPGAADEGVLGDAGTIEVLVGEGREIGARSSSDAGGPPPATRPQTWSRQHLLSSYERLQPVLGYALHVPWFALTGPRDPPVFVNPSYQSAPGHGVFLHELDEDASVSPTVSRLRWLRFPGVVLGLITVLFTYRCGKSYAPDRPGVAIAAAALAGFLPQFTFTAAYLNNDMAAAAVGAILTAWVMRKLAGGGRPTAAWVAGSVLLLALAGSCRLNALGLVGFVLLTCVVLIGRHRGVRGVVAFCVLATLLTGASAAAARVLAPSGWDLLRRQVEVRILSSWSVDSLAGGVHSQLKSFVGHFGWLDVSLPSPLYVAYGVLAAWITVSLVRQLAERDGALAGWKRRVVAVLLGGAVFIELPILRNALATGQAQGRYLFPFLAGLALLGGLSLCGHLAPRAGLRRAGALAMVLFVGNGIALFTGLRPPYRSPMSLGQLTRLDTPAGPVLIQHGRRFGEGRDREGSYPFDPRGQVLVVAPDGEPRELRLRLTLVGAYRRDLLAAALDAGPLTNPSDLPGIRQVSSAGEGQSPSTRVKPMWMKVEGVRQRVLLVQPTSTVVFNSLEVPSTARLRVVFGIDERAWPSDGDGATIRLLVSREGGPPELIVDEHIDPTSRPQDRGWIQVEEELGGRAGEDVAVVLESLPGPSGDNSFDWMGLAKLEVRGAPSGVRWTFPDDRASRVGAEQCLEAVLLPGHALTIQLITLGPGLSRRGFELLVEPLESSKEPPNER